MTTLHQNQLPQLYMSATNKAVFEDCVHTRFIKATFRLQVKGTQIHISPDSELYLMFDMFDTAVSHRVKKLESLLSFSY